MLEVETTQGPGITDLNSSYSYDTKMYVFSTIGTQFFSLNIIQMLKYSTELISMSQTAVP